MQARPEPLIDAVIHDLAPYLPVARQDTLISVREILDVLVDGVEQATIDQLRNAADAASAWGVSERRARAYIATLHQRFGIGRLVGGTWVLLQRHIETFPPGQKYRRAETREAAPMIPITDVPRDPERPRAEETAAPAFQSVTTQQVVGALRAAKLSMTPRAAKSRIGTTSTPGYSARALPNGTVRVDYERATRSYDLDATTYRAQLDAGLAAAQRALHARTIPSRIVPSGTGGFLVAGTAPTPPILTDEML